MVVPDCPPYHNFCRNCGGSANHSPADRDLCPFWKHKYDLKWIKDHKGAVSNSELMAQSAVYDPVKAVKDALAAKLRAQAWANKEPSGTPEDPIVSEHEDTPMGDATQAKSSPVAHVRNGAITKGKKPARPYSWDA